MHGAQQGMPMMGMMPPGMGMGMGCMGMMSAQGPHVDGRVAFLKAELKITDAQLPLWNAVADEMRANAKTMTDMWATMTDMAQSTTLPDRLAAREKMMSARLEGLRKLKAVVDPLYAALSDEQKKSANEIVGTCMGMGRGMGMGGPMMR